MIKYCKCGCGQEIVIKPHHKYYGIPDFIHGHNGRVDKKRAEKISETMKEQYKNGRIHAMKGKENKWGHHTEESNRKNREKHLGKKPWNFGLTKETSDGVRRIAESKIGKKHSEVTRRNMSEAQKGDKGSNWRGGISNKPYSFDFNDEKKERIKQRDNFTCQLCGDKILRNIKRKFLVSHHINYDKMDSRDENLITLCNFCNSSVNFQREDWINYFQGVMTHSR